MAIQPRQKTRTENIFGVRTGGLYLDDKAQADGQRLDFAAAVIARCRVLARNKVIERAQKAEAAGDRCIECGNTPATGACYYCKAD